MNTKNIFAVAMIAGLVSGSIAKADHHEGEAAAPEAAATNEKHSCGGKKGCGGKNKKSKKAKAEKAAAPAESPAADH